MTVKSNSNLRKRKRKATVTPRFGDTTVALEIGLLRMSLGADKQTQFSRDKDKSKE